MTRKITSKSGMGSAEMMTHWLLIICTCGLWYPVYRARRHAANRTTTTVIE